MRKRNAPPAAAGANLRAALEPLGYTVDVASGTGDSAGDAAVDGDVVEVFVVAGHGLQLYVAEGDAATVASLTDPAKHAARLAAERGEVPAATAAIAANEVVLRDRAEQAIVTLQNAWDNWAGLTAAQKDATQKLTVRVVIGLVRLVLRRLDAT